MRSTKFLATFLLTIFMLGQIPQALQSPPSNTFKQGIYPISPEHEGYYRNIRLITPDKPVTITILDSNGNQIFFMKLYDKDNILKLGPIKKEETVIITGDGEISIGH